MVPGETRIKISHNLKYQRYQHLVSDIRGQTVNIIPFEIGASTGYVSYENKSHLKSLHKFCQKNIKLKKFTQNISALTVLSSYLIFNSRNHGWGDMDPIIPPFPNQWVTIMKHMYSFRLETTENSPAGRFVFQFGIHINPPMRFLTFFIFLCIISK